jgi:protein-S-isoprenylcysteine O-methyltransferase Ste14
MNTKQALLHLALALTIFLGLPLLGWGLTDLKTFFSDPGRVGFAFLTLIGAGLTAFQALVIPELRGLQEKRVPRQMILLIVFTIVGAALLFALPWCDRRSLAVMGENTGLRIWGVALLAVGGTILFWSILDFRRPPDPEVPEPAEPQLVTTGWYQHLRHPGYLGLGLMLLGFALIFRSWIGLAAAALAIGALVWRISVEEKMLHQAFGERWEAYCQTTWRLIPRLW